MKTKQSLPPEAFAQAPGSARTSVEGAVQWGVLTDEGRLVHLRPTVDETMDSLQSSIDGGAWRFLERNGWSLVRVLTTYEVLATVVQKAPMFSFATSNEEEKTNMTALAAGRPPNAEVSDGPSRNLTNG